MAAISFIDMKALDGVADELLDRRNDLSKCVAVSAAIGQILKAFTPQECANYFENAGYAPT